jgi:hypothetical protein
VTNPLILEQQNCNRKLSCNTVEHQQKHDSGTAQQQLAQARNEVQEQIQQQNKEQ